MLRPFSFALVLAATSGICLSWASAPAGQNAQVLRGALTSGGHHFAADQWVRSGPSGAVVQLPGATVRLEAGARLRYHQDKHGGLAMDAEEGKLFVSLQNEAGCQVRTPGSLVASTSGEFLVDALSDKALRVEGPAPQVQPLPEQVVSAKAATQAQAWDRLLALDGPDVRVRPKSKKKYTEGEETSGRRIGEDPPSPSPSMSPTATWSPSPSPTQAPPSPSPTTPPPSPSPSPQIGGGPDPWPVIGGLAGLAGIIVLVQDDGDDDEVFRPISP